MDWERIFRFWRKKGDRIVDNESKDMKKFLITCLGNIGPEYVGTRHNAGFMLGDYMAEEAGVPFTSCRYFHEP